MIRWKSRKEVKLTTVVSCSYLGFLGICSAKPLTYVSIQPQVRRKKGVPQTIRAIIESEMPFCE